jgi:hypothetical protein
VVRDLASHAIRSCADPRTGRNPRRWEHRHRDMARSSCAGDGDSYRDWLVEQLQGDGVIPADVAVTWLADEAVAPMNAGQP